MIFRGKPSFDFGPFEAKHVIAWLYPVVSFIVANNGAELLGVLKEHGLTRAGLSAAGVLILRAAWLWYRDNEKDVVT
jgi:hypothetical protein